MKKTTSSLMNLVTSFFPLNMPQHFFWLCEVNKMPVCPGINGRIHVFMIQVIRPHTRHHILWNKWATLRPPTHLGFTERLVLPPHLQDSTWATNQAQISQSCTSQAQVAHHSNQARCLHMEANIKKEINQMIRVWIFFCNDVWWHNSVLYKTNAKKNVCNVRLLTLKNPLLICMWTLLNLGVLYCLNWFCLKPFSQKRNPLL